MSVYGQIILAPDVEDAITALLKDWMDSYLSEMDRVTGRPPSKLPPVQTWGLGDDSDALGVVPPAVYVECAEADMIGGADAYDAQWQTTIAVVCLSERSMRRARELAAIYATNAALICIQQGLPGWEFVWTGQAAGILSSQTRRFIARHEIRMLTHVPEVAARDVGPSEPDAEPGEYPTAQSVAITVNDDD